MRLLTPQLAHRSLPQGSLTAGKHHGAALSHTHARKARCVAVAVGVVHGATKAAPTGKTPTAAAAVVVVEAATMAVVVAVVVTVVAVAVVAVGVAMRAHVGAVIPCPVPVVVAVEMAVVAAVDAEEVVEMVVARGKVCAAPHRLAWAVGILTASAVGISDGPLPAFRTARGCSTRDGAYAWPWGTPDTHAAACAVAGRALQTGAVVAARV